MGMRTWSLIKNPQYLDHNSPYQNSSIRRSKIWIHRLKILNFFIKKLHLIKMPWFVNWQPSIETPPTPLSKIPNQFLNKTPPNPLVKSHQMLSIIADLLTQTFAWASWDIIGPHEASIWLAIASPKPCEASPSLRWLWLIFEDLARARHTSLLL